MRKCANEGPYRCSDVVPGNNKTPSGEGALVSVGRYINSGGAFA